jgi:hypothetical protein
LAGSATFGFSKKLFSIEIFSEMCPTELPIQWIPGLKRPGSEADHSPSSSAEVKNASSYTPTSPIRLYDVVLSLSPLSRELV